MVLNWAYTATQAKRNNTIFRLSTLLSLFFLFLTPSSWAADASSDDTPSLQSFHAVYSAMKWDEDLGKAELKLEHLAGDTYSLIYSSKVSKFFLSDKRFEHSIFNYKAGDFTPVEYHYKRSGTGPDKKLDLTFVTTPDRQVVDAEGNTQAWEQEFDNQLYRLDLPLRLAQGETQFNYHFINSRGQKRNYHMVVEGQETLSLPYGDLETIKVKILRESGAERQTFAWFAPKLDYNLVRFQQFKDGDEQGDVQLLSYKRL